MGRRRGKRNLADRWQTPSGWRAADGCTVLDCGRKGVARGLCWAHYARARRGAPVTVFLESLPSGRLVTSHFGPARPPLSVRRMARIAWEVHTNWTPCPETGCWLWLGEYHSNGYGVIGNARDPWGRWAHRAVLYFNGIDLKRGHAFHVRHLCDNPACVNPAHLVQGTAQENVADRERRYAREGRPARFMENVTRGEAHHGARLTEADVLAIRAELAAGATMKSLADRFGVAAATVQSIKECRTWRHLLPKPNPVESAA